MIKTTKPGRNGTVRITFALPADEPSGAVSVVGDFNDWNPLAHPLRPRTNGTRSAAVLTPPSPGPGPAGPASIETAAAAPLSSHLVDVDANVAEALPAGQQATRPVWNSDLPGTNGRG